VAKNKSAELEYVGWRFWFVVFAVVAVPATYLSFQLVTERTTPLVPVSMGAIGAAISAGVVSWAVNSALQYKTRKRRLAARKKAKKR
jgi:anti-sigma-K factor RskA